MNAIFGIFTQFLYAHMKIYSKITQNITKGQEGVQRGQKRRKNNRYLKKYNITP